MSIALYKRAIEQDPAFGRAYSGWAVAAHYLGRPAESADLFKKALAQIDRMTEREKYRTLGGYYLSVRETTIRLSTITRRWSSGILPT